MTMMDTTDTETTRKRMVRGIKPGIAIVGHIHEERGFASIRTFTFGSHGEPIVSVLDLTRTEAIDIAQALTDLLDADE